MDATIRIFGHYGGDEIDTKAHTISAIDLSADGLTARLRINKLRELHVHELRTSGLKSTAGHPLDHPNAWYTLNRIPSN